MELLQQFWWAGLIPVSIAILFHLWYRHYQKTHVEAQFVIAGCAMGTIVLIYYIVCIIAALFSILGFFLRLNN
jgi:hypothetical protein